MKIQHCTGARATLILWRPLGKAPSSTSTCACGADAEPAGIKAKARLETSREVWELHKGIPAD